MNEDDDDDKQNLFLEACQNGDSNAVAELLKSECDMFASFPPHNVSCMMLAAANGHVDIIRLLLAHAGANETVRKLVNLKDADGNNALMVACLEGEAQVASILIEHSELSARNQAGDTALHIAAKANAVDCVRLITEWDQSSRIITKVRDSNGDTALLAALRSNNVECGKVIVSHSNGKGLNDLSSQDGQTALHLCATGKVPSCDADLISLLVTSKANLNEKNAQGDTPLLAGLRQHHSGEVAYDALTLIILAAVHHNGDSLLLPGKDGESAIVAATRVGNAKLVQMIAAQIIKPGASTQPTVDAAMKIAIETKNRDCEEVVACAQARNGNDPKEALRLLFECICDEDMDRIHRLATVLDLTEIHHKTHDTPLLFAVKSNKIACVDALMTEKGVKSLEMANSEDGRTPLLEAIQQKNLDMVQMLLLYKANVDAVDKDGDCSVMMAIKMNNIDILNALLLHAAPNLNTKSSNGDTPLHQSIRQHTQSQSFSELMRYIESGKSPWCVDAVDKDGNTAVHLAVSLGDKDIVQRLIDAHANLAIRNVDGNTPLLLALSLKNIPMFEMLVMTHQALDEHSFDGAGETALMKAVQMNDDKIVTWLIDARARVDMQDSIGNTALHYVVSMSFEEGHEVEVIEMMVELLIEGGATDIQNDAAESALWMAMHRAQREANDSANNRNGSAWFSIIQKLAPCGCINAEGPDNITPLYAALNFHREDWVDCLLQARADPNKTTTTTNGIIRRHPLILATTLGLANAVYCLIQAGTDANVRSSMDNSCTALFIALQHSIIQCVRDLAETRTALDIPDNDGNLPVLWASRNNAVEALNILYESGANMEVCNDAGANGMMLAAALGHAAVVKYFLDIGNDFRCDAQDKQGWTALLHAMRNNQEECVHLLAKARECDVNTKDATEYAALHVAVENRNLEWITMLLANKADVNLIGPKGNSCLHLSTSATHYSEEIVQLLLEHECSPNAVNHDGESPLMIACQQGNVDLVCMLLEAQAYPDIENPKTGRTAMALVAESGLSEVIFELYMHGADIDHRDHTGMTPLAISTAHGQEDALVTLLCVGSSFDASIDLKSMPSRACAKRLKTAFKVQSLLGPFGAVGLSLASTWNQRDIADMWLKKYLESEDSFMVDRGLHALACVPNQGLAGNGLLKELAKHPKATLRVGARLVLMDVPDTSIGSLMLLTDPFNILKMSGNALRPIFDCIQACKLHMKTKDPNRMHRSMLQTRITHLTELASGMLAGCLSEREASNLMLHSYALPDTVRLATALEHANLLQAKEFISEPTVQLYLNEVWTTGPFSPRFLFASTFVIYIVFMGLLWVTAQRPSRYNYDAMDYLLALWVVGLIFEESHQIFIMWTRELLWRYWKDPQNRMDMFMLGVLISAGILRLFSNTQQHEGNDDLLNLADVIQGVATVSAYFRIMLVLLIHPRLGPLLLMIGRMAQDMIRFMVVLFFSLVAFALGITKLNQGALWCDQGGHSCNQGQSWSDTYHVADVAVSMFWGLFGNYDPAIFINIGPEWRYWIAIIAFGSFMLVTGILLLNLLVAIMNQGYQAIHQSSDVEWKFARALLILDHAATVDHALGRVMVKKCEHRNNIIKTTVREKSLWFAITLVPPPFNILLMPWNMASVVRLIITGDAGGNDSFGGGGRGNQRYRGQRRRAFSMLSPTLDDTSLLSPANESEDIMTEESDGDLCEIRPMFAAKSKRTPSAHELFNRARAKGRRFSFLSESKERYDALQQSLNELQRKMDTSIAYLTMRMESLTMTNDSGIITSSSPKAANSNGINNILPKQNGDHGSSSSSSHHQYHSHNKRRQQHHHAAAATSPTTSPTTPTMAQC